MAPVLMGRWHLGNGVWMEVHVTGEPTPRQWALARRYLELTSGIDDDEAAPAPAPATAEDKGTPDAS